MPLFQSFHGTPDYYIELGMTERDLSTHLELENPMNSDFIDAIDQLLINAHREFASRNQKFFKGYWSKLPLQDQWFAEAESEYLADLITELYSLRKFYIWYDFVQGDTEWFDEWVESREFATDLKLATRDSAAYRKGVANVMKAYDEAEKPYMSDFDVNRRRAQFGSELLLAHHSTPAVRESYGSHREPIDEARDRFEYPGVIYPRAAESLSRWREVLYPLQAEVTTSLGLHSVDLHVARRDRNEITGPANQRHTLLTNEAIPLPRMTTALSWSQYAGVVSRFCTDSERERGWVMLGWMPKLILTYSPPLMPMTKEQLNRGGFQMDETSDAAWSLTSKSKHHRRDDEQRILHGMWRLRTVLMGDQPDQVYVVSEEAPHNMWESRIAAHERAMSQMNFSSSVQMWAVEKYDLTWPIQKLEVGEPRRLKSGMEDPEVVGGYSYDMHPSQIMGDYMVIPWASLSKHAGMHFRFDDKDALQRWCDAYELAMWQAMSLNPAQRWPTYYLEYAKLVAQARRPNATVRVTTRGKQMNVDLSALDE